MNAEFKKLFEKHSCADIAKACGVTVRCVQKWKAQGRFAHSEYSGQGKYVDLIVKFDRKISWEKLLRV
jgi:transposase